MFISTFPPKFNKESISDGFMAHFRFFGEGFFTDLVKLGKGILGLPSDSRVRVNEVDVRVRIMLKLS